LERLYEAAQRECSDAPDHLSGELRAAGARLEELDTAEAKVAARL
jgi:hypothetical protein